MFLELDTVPANMSICDLKAEVCNHKDWKSVVKVPFFSVDHLMLINRRTTETQHFYIETTINSDTIEVISN